MQKKKAARRQPAAPEKRRRRSREEILARIFDAAEEEFKKHGYLGATTAAITREADVTEAQLFRYFDSKDALFREVIFKPIDQHFWEFQRKHEGEPTSATYPLYVNELHRFISQNADALTSLLVAQAYEKRAAQGVGQIMNKAYFNHGAQALRQTHAGEAIHDPQIMVRIAFATVLACVLFKRWIFPKGLAPESEITAALNHFIMTSVATNFEKS